MPDVNNINASGAIEKIDSFPRLGRGELKQIVYNALNSNQYVFSWSEESAQGNASLPYEGTFFDGETEIHLYIYVWNITKTCIINNYENDKRIQIQRGIDDVGLLRPITKNHKTLLLGVYNCPNQPLLAAWDSWHYRDHGSISCYVDVRELKKALDENVSKSNRGSDVYAMTCDYLPVYTSHLKGGNATDLETPSGKPSVSKFKKEYASSKKRSIAQIENLRTRMASLSETERDFVVKQRVGQGYFRELLLQKYGCKCALCSITTLSMLRASHIKAWKASTNDQKLDENNGLLLCAHHDALFDKYLLSFGDDGKPIVSSLIPQEQYESLGITAIPYINVLEEMKPYLRWHRQELKKREQKNNG